MPSGAGVEGHTVEDVSPDPAAPPASCPIGWQPHALAPVFFGARSLDVADGAPVPLRVWFPTLDGAVESAPILAGCGRYPLVVFCHGHCPLDAEHYRRWSLLPAMMARAGYVVLVPELAGNAGGQNPSVSSHPDVATLDAVLAWARTGWEHAPLLMPAPATAIVGHSFGAMLAARFAVGRPITAYAGLSGVWQDWVGEEPFALPRLAVPSLLAWGGPFDFFTQLSDVAWQEMSRPRHRIVFAEGEHWDYLGPGVSPPCRQPPDGGSCPHVAAAVADLLVMFLARYLPPELATDLPAQIPESLAPPDFVLTPEQEFFAGGWLTGFGLLAGDSSCGVELSAAPARLLANRRSKETHSLDNPCPWVSRIAFVNRLEVSTKPATYNWCDFCFPARADG